MSYKAPEMIHINDRTFYLDDCMNPKDVLEYLKLHEFIENHKDGVIC